MHQYRPHGNFAAAISFLRFLQRYSHKIIICLHFYTMKRFLLIFLNKREAESIRLNIYHNDDFVANAGYNFVCTHGQG
jgi:hypothetical protein